MLPLQQASIKYNVSITFIYEVLHRVKQGGVESLTDSHRGRPKGIMTEKERTAYKALQSELESVKHELYGAKLEIALLKKVKALVEEREARQRKNGRGPSKN